MTKGRSRGHTIQLNLEKTVIGRHRDCNLRIPSDDVSRRHCVLTFEDGCLYVEDLGSTNGTLVNGDRITTKKLVNPGDVLDIGPASFQANYEAPPEAVLDSDVIEVVDEQETGEAAGSDKTTKIDFKPEDAPAPVEEVEEVVEIEVDLDAEPIQIPEGEFRDILSGLDEKK
jgi:pSer/pThr/pTyr-binding forkhead associated (FHA) protein